MRNLLRGRPKGRHMLVVAAFYRFFRLENCEALKERLQYIVDTSDIYGTILLAHEGINGTVCGSRASIDRLKAAFSDDPRLIGMEYKESYTETNPFIRRHVKIKNEIVSLGQQGIDPSTAHAQYVDAREWDALLADPTVLVLDVRNKYETKVGSFIGAIDPALDNFRQFPDYVAEHLDPKIHKRIAMSCTGGIRCEKASAYLKQQGFDNVYQLHGGILRYMMDTPKDNSSWRGECFVFDHRVTVDHDLKPGSYTMCFNCRLPLSLDDKKSESYVEAVVCAQCCNNTSKQKRDANRDRQQQIRLANSRGETHLGPNAMTTQRR